MAITVKGQGGWEPGCVIDGHWGQYGASRLLRIADEALGTSYFAEAEREARSEAQRLAAPGYETARLLYKLDQWDAANEAQRLAAFYASAARDPYGVMTSELPNQIVLEIADEAEGALNDATEGGFWEWVDGEFFLVEMADVDCPKCDERLALDSDGGVYCLDEMCSYNAEEA